MPLKKRRHAGAPCLSSPAGGFAAPSQTDRQTSGFQCPLSSTQMYRERMCGGWRRPSWYPVTWAHLPEHPLGLRELQTSLLQNLFLVPHSVIRAQNPGSKVLGALCVELLSFLIWKMGTS